jgi:hypothetical protein
MSCANRNTKWKEEEREGIWHNSYRWLTCAWSLFQHDRNILGVVVPEYRDRYSLSWFRVFFEIGHEGITVDDARPIDCNDDVSADDYPFIVDSHLFFSTL